MTRRIIQIAAATNGHGDTRDIQLFALCDDGTVWANNDPNPWNTQTVENPRWFQLPQPRMPSELEKEASF